MRAPAVSTPGSLRPRIEAMARRWGYSPAEVSEVLKLARADPEPWRAAVALDEQRESEFRARGILSESEPLDSYNRRSHAVRR